VKRRAKTASGAKTQKVQAVKRAPPWKALEKSLYGVHAAKVLRRGALKNAAGKQDDGWQVRTDEDDDLFAFVATPESGLRSFARVLGRRYELVLDVMLGKERVASLVMHKGWNDAGGVGQLVDLEKNEIVTIETTPGLGAQVTQGGHPVPLLTLSKTRHSHTAKAGKRQVADVHTLQAGKLIPRVDGYRARFDDEATPFERFLTVAAIAFADLHALRPAHDDKRGGQLERLFPDL
jgi:hypothetical protein